MMRRRDFITLLGGAAAAWPLAARAQQGGKLPRLGILSPGRSELPEPGVTMLDAFVQGLHELGYAEGRDLILERRYAEWRPERLRELAAEAIDIAADQGAKSLELRASVARARHCAKQGEGRKALDLLSPIYGRFSQGLETPDLLQAKSLLGELR